MAIIERYNITKRGSMIFTGNSLGMTTQLGQAGAFITLNLADQVPGYPAGTTLNWMDNESAAQLNIPPGSTVLYAELQWGGVFTNGVQDVTAFINDPITFNTPVSSYSLVSEASTAVEFGGFYSRSTPVTSIINNDGNGSYSVAAVPATILGNNNTVGWTLGVIYENISLPIQNMTIYSGIQYINGPLSPVDFTISGFLAPPVTPINGRVLISAMEGDPGGIGDQVLIGPNAGSLVNLVGPNNQLNNFFQSNINNGVSESPNVGLIDTTGTFGTYNQPSVPCRYGWDITNVESNNFIVNQTSAVVRLTSIGDGLAVPLMGVQLDAIGFDFGDAPDTSVGNSAFNYRTLLISDGPRHGVVDNLKIGNSITIEDDAYQNIIANGDDLNEGIQDDGPLIIPLPSMNYNTNSYTLDLSVLNNTGIIANIYAWLDFNQNGVFETNESVEVNINPSPSYQNISLVFTRPIGNTLYIGNTFIRVRLTTENLVNTGGLNQEDTRSFGMAINGEVEDYILDITNEPFNCNRNGYRVSD